MIARVLVIVFVGAVVGAIVWQTARYVSLPVLSAADGEGHGPDRGTSEWDAAVEHATRQKERQSVIVGVVAAVVAIAVLSYAAIR